MDLLLVAIALLRGSGGPAAGKADKAAKPKVALLVVKLTKLPSLELETWS